MKLTTFATLAFCLCAFSTFAQSTYSIRGITVDSTSKTKFAATIIVMNAKDSILRKYTRSAADGSFSVTGLPPGQFILLVTHPDYSEFSAKFTLNPASREHNFGTIKMAPPALALKEVNIKSEVTAIKIKGDTIEYNAKAYVVQPNDKVEELLKQLPGFEVDKDGHIKVAGEAITKVLLDGEEFFGDDPTLITRNIRGDMVDKIQYYEKKSDMAKATGIDDGKGQKVLNVQLKEDRRTGVFGKVLAGGGTGGYYEGQGFVNKFTQNYKAAAYGTISNDGKVGLGAADNSRLGMNNLMIIGATGGGISFSSGASSQLDRETYSGQGLPETKTGGLHYDTKWNKGSETLNANYKAGDLSNKTDRNVLSRTIYTTNTEDGVSDQHIISDLNRQKIDGVYTKRLKSGNLRVDVNASIQNAHDQTTNNTITTNDDGTLKNTNNHYDDVKVQERSFNTNIFYTTAIKKSFFSWSLQEGYDQSKSTEYLKNAFTTPSSAGNSFTDQYKPDAASGLALASNMSFSKSLSKKLSMVLNYDITLNNSTSDLPAYNLSSPGVYNVLDTAYSSNYKLNQVNNQLGLSFRIPIGKSSLNFGNGANVVSFRQTNENTGYIYERKFVNWAPRANFSYFAGQSKSANFSYFGSSRQPSITQVQPVPNNNNLQYIVKGNPDLKPYFTNSFNGNYRAFDQLTGQTFLANGGYSFTSSPIIYNQSHDTTTGKTISQFVNLTGKITHSYNLNLSYSKKITAWDIQVTEMLFTVGNTGYTVTDGVLVMSNTHYYEESLRLRKDKLKKYFITAAVIPNWNFYSYSPNTAQLKNYFLFNFKMNAEAAVYLPGKTQISSLFHEEFRAAYGNLPAQTINDWSVTFSKTVLKGDALKLSLTCNNLLNEGGVNRNGNAIQVTQTTYNTIKRFFLFSLSWDFAHFPSVPVK